MKMSPQTIKKQFNELAKRGGEAVIRNEAVWRASGLEDRFGPWQDGKMAICAFAGEVQENSQVIRVLGVTEGDDRLIAQVSTGILGGPPSRPGHFSYPQDVKFVEPSDKPVQFEYNGVIKPGFKPPVKRR